VDTRLRALVPGCPAHRGGRRSRASTEVMSPACWSGKQFLETTSITLHAAAGKPFDGTASARVLER
jgi:hypothetical protein